MNHRSDSAFVYSIGYEVVAIDSAAVAGIEARPRIAR
jgi:hypothetical protein